ncbi:MAG: ABC transporter permease [Pirellulales bacterium]|nr:ABC transporter permease [Pirellulales bacterium]
MNFFTFITKNLLRRRTRSVLTIIGLAVAVAAVVSLVGVATGFERSFIGMYNQREIDLVVQSAGGRTNLNNLLPESLLGKLVRVDGVKQVLGGSVDLISFTAGDQHLENLPTDLISVPINGWPLGSALYNRLRVIAGSKLQPGDTGKVMLGRELAANLQKKVGDKVPVYGAAYEVAGIFESDAVFENGAVIIPLSELQKGNGSQGKITGFTIQVKKPIDEQGLEKIRKDIEALMPGKIVAKAPTDFVESIDEIRTARAVAWITSAIALFIGAIGMLNTMVMSVFERTREIGTLRAIGWKRSRIARMVIGESLLLSIGGAIAGSLAGIALTKFLSELPNGAGIITGSVPPPVIAQGFAFAVLVGLFGAIYPALWSANLLPTEALRRK